jgi:hypothetical protein
MLALRIHLYHHKGQKISVSEHILGVFVVCGGFRVYGIHTRRVKSIDIESSQIDFQRERSMSCICRLEVVVLILFAMDFVSRDVEDMLLLLQVLISKVRRVSRSVVAKWICISGRAEMGPPEIGIVSIGLLKILRNLPNPITHLTVSSLTKTYSTAPNFSVFGA